MISTMMSVVACAVSMAAGGVPVVVRPLAGPEQTGALVRLDSERVTVEIDGHARDFAVRDLQTVLFTRDPIEPAELPPIRVQLLDGSMIVTDQYTVKDRLATVTVGAGALEILTRSVKSVRFRPPSKSLDPQWQETVDGQFAGDIVVLRRSDKSLDQLEGILHDATNDTVEFEFDDEKIPVKRTKLEGIVYLHPTTVQLPKILCRIHEIGGTCWCVKTVRLDGAQLHVVTAGGITTDVTLAHVARLDFSSGNVVYLSDKVPESIEWTPFLGSRVAPERLAKMYQPRRDRSFDGEGLWLGTLGSETRYKKGLCIHSRTLLTYRVGGEYRKFTAVAGIDSRLAGRGNVHLVITGDDKTLYQQAIAGDDAPVPLDLDIDGVQRLKILVDFGQSADIADHLNLCDARLIK